MSERRAAYREWRAAHPEVYALFLKFAKQMADRHQRFGVRFLIERVRWEVRTTWAPDADGFKLNNNLTPHVARDLIEDMPALANLLELRYVPEDDEEPDHVEYRESYLPFHR